eukprot:scaffold77905_cov58-Attheya_sp.AAC.7
MELLLSHASVAGADQTGYELLCAVKEESSQSCRVVRIPVSGHSESYYDSESSSTTIGFEILSSARNMMPSYRPTLPIL